MTSISWRRVKEVGREAVGVLVVAGVIVLLDYCSAQPAHAGDTRVYLGLGWTHVSNYDMGSPFNDNWEDNADHVGIEGEVQFHQKRGYGYFTATVGRTKVTTRTQSGWDCTGCKYPGTIRFGYKWQLY